MTRYGVFSQRCAPYRTYVTPYIYGSYVTPYRTHVTPYRTYVTPCRTYVTPYRTNVTPYCTYVAPLTHLCYTFNAPVTH